MPNDLVYNIALAQLPDYADCSLIVRSAQAQALADHLSADKLDNLAYVQLYSLPSDSQALIHWAEGLSIEIMLDSPAADFPQLYRYAKLLDNHPVRVRMPVTAGFEKAVKLALSLQFSVRLDLGQPDKVGLEQLTKLLDLYLHQTAVSQPVELYHNLLLAFCHDEALTLWAMQEEDPALIRYINEQGTEHFPGKLYAVDPGGDPLNFVTDWSNTLVAEQAECASCAFLDRCQGYFKWPERDYDCAGIKILLQTLQQAAAELRDDLAAAATARG